MVIAAGRNDTIRSQAALERLCSIYWYPLYAFVRRQGFVAADAQDLTQSFFARLIEKQDLADVDRAKGKFRSFLLAAMKNFLANEWDKMKAQKRGGGWKNFTSLDAKSAETRYAVEPADPMTADKIFERNWALTLLDEVLKHVREDFESEGKLELFEALKSTLTSEKNAQPYSEIAAKLGMSEGAVKVAVHRLRHRYRDALRAEIAATVANPEEVDEELRHLFAALTG
jgi:RNA polymerase sigma-70 factor (ECF subfamily)